MSFKMKDFTPEKESKSGQRINNKGITVKRFSFENNGTYV